MSWTSYARPVAVVLLVSLTAACSPTEALDAPPAPVMPAGWTITSDQSFPPAEVRRMSGQIGGEMLALRNTVYDVGGKRVQLNTLVAADAANADKIMEAMRAMKPDDFLLRRGLILYEFVVKNEAIGEARAGKAHIVAADTHGDAAGGAAAGGAASSVQGRFDSLIAAIQANDRAAFVANATDAVAAGTTQQIMSGLSQHLGTRVKQGYQDTYLTRLTQVGHDVHLWKLTFTDRGDDVVVRVVLNDDKLAGFFIQ